MYLQRLEIKGFKSFANKTRLDFKPGVTCIVGPNGSGKSNLVDALRWGLGEQSLKNLRGKKSTDIIFSGSDKASRQNLAEVSIDIDNPQRQAIDYTNLLITRRIYLNGEGEYLINESKSRLQDILFLLAKISFGQKNYSIISQGEIDSIIKATPQERRDYFNEAVGVKQYQFKQEKAINKLKSVQENLEQTQLTLKEIIPQLTSLTRQVKRLEKREKIEQELESYQTTYYAHLWQQINQQQAKLKINFDNLNQKIDQAQTEFNQAKNKIDQIKIKPTRSQLFDQLQEKYQHIIDLQNQLRQKEFELKSQLIQIPTQNISIQLTPQLLNKIIQDLKNIIEIQDKILSQINQQSLENLQQVLIKNNQQLKILSQQLSPTRDNSAQKELNKKINEQLAKISQDLQTNQDNLKNVQQEISDFNKTQETKNQQLFKQQEELQQKQFELNELNSQLNEVKIDLARIEVRQEDLMREIEQDFVGKNIDQIKKCPATTQPNSEEIKSEIYKLKHQLEIIGGIDPETVQEYTLIKERYDFLNHQVEDLNQAIQSLEKIIKELNQKIKNQFEEKFETINKEFNKFFTSFFDGGKAELILKKEETTTIEENEELDPEFQIGQDIPDETLDSETSKRQTPLDKILKIINQTSYKSIEIHATPPGKKLKNIEMLSGGEKALTSLALICAIISSNPPPFIILDEVDAALDENNSHKFAKILKDLAHKTQFIVITHNRYTMEIGEILYGVTMSQDGISKIVSLKLDDK
ncbi:MAG: AAA family ATPase [Patescibacteria group bacterium]|nr:AAA family ATPase [Patescibacteria group bacterium]